MNKNKILLTISLLICVLFCTSITTIVGVVIAYRQGHDKGFSEARLASLSSLPTPEPTPTPAPEPAPSEYTYTRADIAIEDDGSLGELTVSDKYGCRTWSFYEAALQVLTGSCGIGGIGGQPIETYNLTAESGEIFVASVANRYMNDTIGNLNLSNKYTVGAYYESPEKDVNDVPLFSISIFTTVPADDQAGIDKLKTDLAKVVGMIHGVRAEEVTISY